MASNEPPHWEAPKFSFTAENQAKEWKKFHTRVIDFLEALNIDPDTPDESKHGWHQIKMMFQDEDREALQALLDNNTITPEDQLTPPIHKKPYKQQSRKMNISGTTEMNSSVISDKNIKKASTHSTTELHSSSTTVSLLIQLLKRH